MPAVVLTVPVDSPKTLRTPQVRLLPFLVSLTMSESEKHHHASEVPVLHASESAYVLGPGTVMGSGDPVPFKLSSLWGPAVLNPLNHKSFTVPIFNLRSAYARNFHLSWLGFMVAL